jgi:hypothetical protein
MPHDRRSRQVLLAMLGMVGVAMSVGCARSSNLRSSAGPLPELAPAGELHPDAGPAAPAGKAPTPAPATGSPGPDAIASPPCPASDDGTNPRGSAASPSRAAPFNNLEPIPTSPSNPVNPAGASRDPDGTEAANEAAPGAGPSTSPAPSGEAPAPPASPTPLLDAEIRRAQSVTRQHFESLIAPETPPPAPPGDPAEPPAARPATAAVLEPKPADPEPDLEAPLPPLAAAAGIGIEPGAASPAPRLALPTLMPVDPAASGAATTAPMPPPKSVTTDGQGSSPAPAAANRGVPEGRRPTLTTGEEGPDGTDGPAAGPPPADEDSPSSGKPATEADRAERPTLEIAALRLCSKVGGFGAVEPVNPDALKPGQLVGVYWEMSGVEYRAQGDVFVSRLAAHLELRSGPDGPVVWEQALGTAQDVCPRRRRDYYASYPIDLPRTLEPGPYRLRLTQTDLIGNRVASREVSVTIVR